jgi:hypothetical protein
MKTRYTLYLIFIYCFSVFGQNRNISGTYVSEYGTKIEISNNEFFYIVPQDHSPFWYNDTLAVCTFDFEDDSFISLKTVHPIALALKDMTIVQMCDTTLDDNVLKVSFNMPYQKTNLIIELFTNTYHEFSFDYSTSNQSMMIPEKVKTVSFYITPERITPHRASGLFYGVIGVESFQDFTINENVNSILFELPAINDSFFENYYLNNDYVKISNDTITWKGDAYIKMPL